MTELYQKPDDFRSGKFRINPDHLNQMRQAIARQLRGAGKVSIQHFGDRPVVNVPDDTQGIAGPSNYIKQFVVLQETADYLVCVSLQQPVNNNQMAQLPFPCYSFGQPASLLTAQVPLGAICVAKPYTLQASPWIGQTVIGGVVSFIPNDGRAATRVLTQYVPAPDDSDSVVPIFIEQQAITPSYLQQEVILAVRAITGLLDPSGKPIVWADLNTAGRTWQGNTGITDSVFYGFASGNSFSPGTQNITIGSDLGGTLIVGGQYYFGNPLLGTMERVTVLSQQSGVSTFNSESFTIVLTESHPHACAIWGAPQLVNLLTSPQQITAYPSMGGVWLADINGRALGILTVIPGGSLSFIQDSTIFIFASFFGAVYGLGTFGSNGLVPTKYSGYLYANDDSSQNIPLYQVSSDSPATHAAQATTDSISVVSSGGSVALSAAHFRAGSVSFDTDGYLLAATSTPFGDGPPGGNHIVSIGVSWSGATSGSTGQVVLQFTDALFNVTTSTVPIIPGNVTQQSVTAQFPRNYSSSTDIPKSIVLTNFTNTNLTAIVTVLVSRIPES